MTPIRSDRRVRRAAAFPVDRRTTVPEPAGSRAVPGELRHPVRRAAGRTVGQLAAAVLLAGALGACTTTFGGGAQPTGIGYQDARLTEMVAMREWRACRDEAVDLAAQARDNADPARYLASARLLERCEADLGPEVQHLATEERMRAYATAVQNHLRGGDVARARETLGRFRETFPAQDLYLADGAAFTETMDLLLGLADRRSVGEYSTANVPVALKKELRRVRYWERH